MAKYILLGVDRTFQARDYSIGTWVLSRFTTGTNSVSIFVPKSVARLITYESGQQALYIFQNWFYQKNISFFK